jgi:hypothetical protein
MREAIENAFPQVVNGGCLEAISEGVFYIFDSATEPQRCFIRKVDSDPIHFTVRNPQYREIYFLAIDKCIFQDGDSSRCDCAVFDDKEFNFIEISESKKLHRNEKRKKALSQLGNTVDLFRASGIQLPVDVNAIVCFVGKNIFPARNSQNNEARLAFYEERGVVLLEGNEHVL